jgi:hypothetical protein
MNKKTEIDPSFYGLSARIQLELLSEKQIAIRKVIKSRIIQKDAIKIVNMFEKIKSVHPDLECTLICTRNICSKSTKLLQNEGITLTFVD